MLTIANIAGWIWAHKKFVGIVAACIVGLLLLWWGLTAFGNYRATRKIDQALANAKAAVAAANAAKGTVANARVNEAVAIEQVKQAANDAIATSNATDQAKAEANQAVANFVAAKNANMPTGTTEADLDAKLKALGQ